MSSLIFLAVTGEEASKAISESEMIKQIHAAINQLPPNGLKIILVVSVISLVGILWLVHRQYRLARNQVKLAGMLEELSKRSGR